MTVNHDAVGSSPTGGAIKTSLFRARSFVFYMEFLPIFNLTEIVAEVERPHLAVWSSVFYMEFREGCFFVVRSFIFLVLAA